LSTGTVGAVFNSGAIVVAGGSAPLTFSVATGALPAGLTLNTSTGAVTGTPTATGAFTLKVTDANGIASTTCSFTINAAPSVTCPSTALSTGTVGAVFNSGAIVAAGGTAPLTFSVATGALPAGLTLNTATGAVTGTPTAAGSFTLKVTDTNGASSTTCPFTINAAPALTCPAGGLSTGTVGVVFNSGAITVTSGTAPFTFSLATGALPAGLALNAATGAVTGTPTATGVFTLKVTDVNGIASGTCSFSVSPPVPPSVPDMTITKSHTGNFTQGQIGATFTLGTSNVGSQATSGTVTVNDNLPPGLTATAIAGQGWTCFLASLSCQRSDNLQPGASYPPITVTVNVGASVTGTLINGGVVGGGGEVNLTNDNAYDPVTINPIPDLTITKSHTGTMFQPGGSVTFSLVGNNIGPGSTNGLVTITDTLPAGLTATAISGSPTFACTLSTLTCTTNTVLAPGASYPPITVTASIAVTATGTLVNNARIGGGSEVNLTNDTATDSIALLIPDMTISKTHTGNSFSAGGSVTFTLSPSNVGSAPTIGTVTVTDTLPAGLTATAIGGSGWTCVLSTLSCTTSAVLAVNASYPPISVTAAIAASATGTLVNNTTVGGGGEVNLTNDTAADSIVLSGIPDLAITKTHTGTSFAPGGSVTFTLTPNNLGPAATTGTVTVTDTLPAGLTATAIGGSSWTCAALPALSCTRSDSLAPGASYPPITVTASIATSATGTLVNNAQVGGGGETNLTNDTATDSITVAVPDLTITKTHTGTTFVAGGSVTFTLTANNIGIAPTSGTVTVTDTLPAGLTATAISGPAPWVCAAPPALSCTRGDVLAPGASYSPITLTASIATNATGTLVNNALVGGGSEVNLTNDTATDSIVVSGVPDMTINKSHTGTLTRGATGVYTLIASNVGGTATTGAPVTVTDTLPAGLAATAISGASPWSCTLSTLSCTASAVLAPGAAFPPITVTVVVAGNAPSSILNTATVGGGGEVNLTNDTATDPAVLSGSAPNLSITKTSNGTFLAGGTGSFTMVVSNNGTGPTSGVVTLSDPPLSFLTPTSVAGDGWTCVLSTVTCTRSDVLAPGASFPAVILTVNIAANAPKNFTNVASTSGGGSPSTFSTTGSSTVALTVVISNFNLTKTADHTQAQIGDVIGYTLQVTNSTVSPFPNAQVQDTPPTGFVLVPGSARLTSGTGAPQPITPVLASGVLTFLLGTVAPQQTIVITYRLQIGAKARPGRNVNIAQAVAGPSASNAAQVTVVIDSSLFTTRQFLIGRVFEDSNGNGIFDPGERPVAGVRVYLSNSGSATTDSKGLYNIPTIAPGSVVVSIDPATLPKGYTNSSGGRLDAESWSRLVRTPLGEGMILRQNFALKPCPYCAPAISPKAPGAASAAISSRPAAKLEILPSQESLPGDGRTSMAVRVRALDAEGNLTRVKEIRVRTSAGQFALENDLASASNATGAAGANALFGKHTEPQLGQSVEQVPQTMQAAMARSVDGEATFLLMAANTPGVARLVAESGDPDHLLSASTDIWYTPEKRSPILVTDGEITVGRAAPEVPILGQGGEVTRRADIFLRTPLAADYLMTLGYTSHLTINDSNGNPGLFQTDPLNRVYQVYGDSSTQYQAAQSNAHAYGRIEHGQSYVMFGDLHMSEAPVNGAPAPASQAFNPQVASPAPVTYGVGDYNRNVVGAAIHLEDSHHDFITLEGARPNTGFARDVFPGSTFGLIQLSHIDILPGSESGVIETRDVHNPEIILSSEQLVRSVDYDINPYTGGIFFLRTLNAFDQALNLVQVVFTYEYQSTSGVSSVYGIRTQARIDSWGLKLGLGVTEQRDPGAGSYYLGDINLHQKLPYKGRLSVEVPVSHGSALAAGFMTGTSANVNGVAVRADIDQPFPWLSGRFRGSYSKTDAGFFNPFGTTVIPGAQTSRGAVEISPLRRLRLKLGFTDEHNRTSLVNNQRQSASLEAKQSLTETLVFTAGYDFRDFQDALAAREVQSNEVSAALEWKPFSRFTASARREQNLSASDPTYPNETLLTARYQATETVRLFATERLSSAPILPIGDLSTTGFSALAGKNETAIGIDDKWSKYTTLQSKYLIENGINGTDTFAVIGLMNRLPVQEHFTLDLGLERGELITGKDRSFDAGSIGFSWLPTKNFRASTRYEIRDLGGLGQIVTTGVAGRIADGLTTLARFQYSDAAFQPGTGAVDVLNPLGTNSSTLPQQSHALQGIAALAWRPWKTDREGILFSYTLRDASLNGIDTSLPQNDRVSMLSTDGFVQATRYLEFYGKFALSDRTYNYTGASPLSTLTYLWQGRTQAKISRRFDVAGEARLVYQPDTDIHQWTAGVEGGFWVMKDLRAGVGYSFRSADEIAANFLTVPAKQGVYFVLTSKMSNMFNLFKSTECGCAAPAPARIEPPKPVANVQISAITGGRDVCPGDNLQLRVTASGWLPDQTPVYQWYIDDRPVAGATGTSLAVPTTNGSGNKSVKVSVTAGGVTKMSEPVSVLVKPTPPPTIQFTVSPSVINYGDKLPLAAHATASECTTPATIVYTASAGTVNGATFDSTGVNLDMSNRARPQSTTVRLTATATDRIGQTASATADVTINLTPQAVRLDDLVFGNNSDRVNNCGKRLLIEELTPMLRADPGAKVILIGHRDTGERSTTLDRQRVLNAAAVLSAGKGICPQLDLSRILVKMAGTDQSSTTRPALCGSSTQERSGQAVSASDTRAQFRRVEIWLVPSGAETPAAITGLGPLPSQEVAAKGCPR
jgi:uncharacterized repeat protein (TIGR01451 family)